MSVSCGSAGSCAAGGIEGDGDASLGLLETLAGGVWTAAPVPVPAGGSSGGLSSAACAAAGSCVAVGSYNDSSGNSQGLIETQAR